MLEMIQLDRYDETKLESARAIVRGLDSVLVAFSGGVDSSLLLKLALAELHDNAVAVLASSPAYPESEQQEARNLAAQLGARLIEVSTNEVELEAYRRNNPDRCCAAARRMGLPNWNKASFACLSSRIPHGTEVTVEALRQIEASEAAVKALGFRQVRVRHHGDVARIEVESEEIGRLLENREQVVDALRAAGYKFVSLDLEGYSSGSLNRTWKPTGN